MHKGKIAMLQYLELMRHVIENGIEKQDRTGTGTRSVFGRQIRFDLVSGFPLLTTKKVHIPRRRLIVLGISVFTTNAAS